MILLLATLSAAEPLGEGLPLPTAAPGTSPPASVPVAPLPGPDDHLPIADGPVSVPTWVQVETVDSAARDAVDHLDLSALTAPAYALSIEVEDAPPAVGTSVGKALVQRLEAAGHSVRRDARAHLVVRVGTNGVVRTYEPRTLAVPERRGLPWTLVSLGATALTIGTVGVLAGSSNGGTASTEWIVLTGAGAVATGTGVGLFMRPPRQMDVRCPVFDAAVQVSLYADSGAAPKAVAASAGKAHVPENLAPCTGNMKRLTARGWPKS